jgi:hypothetical protein
VTNQDCQDFYRTWLYEYHDWCFIGSRNCLPFENIWIHPRIFGGVSGAHLISFLCCVFSFVWLSFRCLEHSVGCVSGLSSIHCSLIVQLLLQSFQLLFRIVVHVLYIYSVYICLILIVLYIFEYTSYILHWDMQLWWNIYFIAFGKFHEKYIIPWYLDKYIVKWLHRVIEVWIPYFPYYYYYYYY